MLQRFYVNNFRCLENFELNLKDQNSSLLIGKNGTGKSTISYALQLLQNIGRGVNRIRELINADDIGLYRREIPIRFEIEVELSKKIYKYILVLELPPKFEEIRIRDEQLWLNEKPVYIRAGAGVKLGNAKTSSFGVDWHLVALPIIQSSDSEPLQIFKNWLAHIVILSPIPSLMNGNSKAQETLLPNRDASNFGEWFSGLLGQYPAAYNSIDNYLRNFIADLGDIQNPMIGKDFRSIYIQFASGESKLKVNFNNLSDGEKCFFLSALVLAANKHYGPILCFWDEPDNFLSLSEVGHFITSLRKSFSTGGQLLITSHNEESIRKFSNENTFLLDRKSHLEPTLIRRLDSLKLEGDLVEALILNEVSI